MRTTSTTRALTGRLAIVSVAALGALSACGGADDDDAAAFEAAANGEALTSDDVADIADAAEAQAEAAGPDVDLPDPCTLLAPADAAGALGQSVTVNGPTDAGIDMLECSFLGAPADSSDIGGQVFVRTSADCGEPCHFAHDQNRDAPELGDHGYVNEALSIAGWTGDGVVYEVQMIGAAGPATADQLLALAQAAQD